MGGLIFLFVIALWVAICVYLAFKIPKWLGIQRLGWLLGLLLFPALLVAPVIDELIGMRQFEQLCKERAVVHVSPAASEARRAKRSNLPSAELSGYWIPIRSQPFAYVDADTGKPLLSYEALFTKGGRIAGIALMGGTHSCTPEDLNEAMKKLNLGKLVEEGKQP